MEIIAIILAVAAILFSGFLFIENKKLKRKVAELESENESIVELIDELKNSIQNTNSQIEKIEKVIRGMEFTKMTLTEIADNTQKTFLGDAEIPNPWGRNVTDVVQIAVKSPT